MSERRVLVTDGEQRSALAIVRSLGGAGAHVVVTSNRAQALAASSRWCRRAVVLPSPLKEPARYADAVVALVRDERITVVLPVTEASLLALLPRRDELGDALLPWPDLATFQRICDKGAVLDAASAVGIAVPQQVTLHSADEARQATSLPPFPVVCKPARSVSESGGTRRSYGVQHASTLAEFQSIVAGLDEGAFPLLVQQRVMGPGMGVFVLRWNGEVRATFAHRRLREKPPAGGVSVYREAIALPGPLAERSSALLARLGWQGVAMVEYKVEATTNTPYLMEINGRFWGSLQLAIDAGVDFPLLLVEVAEGGGPPSPPTWRAGVRSRWFWGDIDHLLAMVRRSPSALHLPPDHPGRLATMARVLLPRLGDINETLRWSDPAPFLAETRDWFRGL